MNRIFNFNAGPSTLPLPVLEQVRDEFVDYAGKGMSIVEMSHRSPEYDKVHHNAMDLIRELFPKPCFAFGGDDPFSREIPTHAMALSFQIIFSLIPLLAHYTTSMHGTPTWQQYQYFQVPQYALSG